MKSTFHEFFFLNGICLLCTQLNLAIRRTFLISRFFYFYFRALLVVTSKGAFLYLFSCVPSPAAVERRTTHKNFFSEATFCVKLLQGLKLFFLEGDPSRSLKLKNPFLAISISVTRHSLLSVHRAKPFLELGLRLSLIEKKNWLT